MFSVAYWKFEPARLDIKAWISRLGIALSLVVALGGPLSYASVNLIRLNSELEFRAQLSASRASKYIYAQGPLWLHHKVRLAELIEQPDSKRGNFKQTLSATQGQIVVDEDHQIAWPTIDHTVPVTVDAKTLGYITIASSVTDILAETVWVALFCLLLAGVTFCGLRMLPLAGLRRMLNELAVERQQTESANEKLTLALNNTSHGLVLYDHAGRAILSNKVFEDSLADHHREPRQNPTFLELTGRLGLTEKVERLVDENSKRLHLNRDHRQEELCHLDDGRVFVVEIQTVRSRGILVTIKDVTEQHRAQSEIAYLAHFDTLTGLANRVALQSSIEVHLKGCTPSNMVALMLIDLDRFKAVNDTLGHPIGDELLRQVASRLKDSVRKADTVARLGGDEFAVIIANVSSIEEIHPISARVLKDLAQPFDVQGHRVDISGSIGIAIGPNDSRDVDVLFKRADIALYASKASGRNACRYFETGMDVEIEDRHRLERDLRRAIEDGGFELNYQPLYGLAANRIEGFEALLRWRHASRGLVSPAEFVPLAEETGLIKQIGAWVLRQACVDAASWPADISVAVNLSSVQFTDGLLVSHVKDAIKLSGLAPERLELEITESIILQDTEATLAILQELKDLGAKISMDDFGTGYSSLSYLQRFPFDKIKIDRAFVDGINNKSDSLAIVRAVTSMSRSLGMKTTGEGVETEAELNCLRAEGCSQAQGYLISRPVAASAIANLVAGAHFQPLAA